ncbi:hypothetical protein [Phascolarctobacterium succinatutens]|uniref:hypothetical protein n=1 Tax=Phascolarctobacterium succinatutens TaxID=626940 RepID=UPI0026ED1A74|nr:hypothetical protein [Phascolarctobacterium succinatutens]
MEFMIGDDVGLCRYGSGSGYHEGLKGKDSNCKWCVDGYAAVAFVGFESARSVSEDEAVKYIVDVFEMSKEEAVEKLNEKGLDKDKSIKYLGKTFGDNPRRAKQILGLLQSKTISKNPEW